MESSPLEQHHPPRLGPRTDRLTARQQDLLEQLESIIVEEGFCHLTVGSLASRLRCSRRTLYGLAPTKDELVLVVLDRRLRRTGRLAREQIAAVDDAADKIDAYLIRSGLRPTSLRFAEDIARTPAAGRLFADHYRFAMAMLGNVLQDGMASGRIRSIDPIVIAEIIDAALERLSHPDVLRATGRSFFEVSEELSLLVRFGLVTETPRPSRRDAEE
jgi:AcrR family transcriptional regulator